MVVQHNMQAANANRMLNVTTGQQAKSTEMCIRDRMYTVTGDFSLMVNWDKFFGSTSAVKEAEKTSQGVEAVSYTHQMCIRDRDNSDPTLSNPPTFTTTTSKVKTGDIWSIASAVVFVIGIMLMILAFVRDRKGAKQNEKIA